MGYLSTPPQIRLDKGEHQGGGSMRLAKETHKGLGASYVVEDWGRSLGFQAYVLAVSYQEANPVHCRRLMQQCD